jgi:hypothetical protein
MPESLDMDINFLIINKLPFVDSLTVEVCHNLLALLKVKI